MFSTKERDPREQCRWRKGKGRALPFLGANHASTGARPVVSRYRGLNEKTDVVLYE